MSGGAEGRRAEATSPGKPHPRLPRRRVRRPDVGHRADGCSRAQPGPAVKRARSARLARQADPVASGSRRAPPWLEARGSRRADRGARAQRARHTADSRAVGARAPRGADDKRSPRGAAGPAVKRAPSAPALACSATSCWLLGRVRSRAQLSLRCDCTAQVLRALLLPHGARTRGSQSCIALSHTRASMWVG